MQSRRHGDCEQRGEGRQQAGAKSEQAAGSRSGSISAYSAAESSCTSLSLLCPLVPLSSHTCFSRPFDLSHSMQSDKSEDQVLDACEKVEGLDINDNVSDKKVEEQESAAGDGTPAAAAPLVNGHADWLSGMGLRPEVVQSLARFGLPPLTAEQRESVRLYTEKAERVTLLESGTERTISLVVKAAVMQQLDPQTLEHQLLILTAHRVASLQTARVIRGLGDGHGLRVRACIGGSPLYMDIRSLRSGVQVVIGTTGRIIDLLERCILNTSYFKTIVLENADAMLEDHKYEVYRILKKLPEDVHVVLLSNVCQETKVVEAMNTLLAATPEEMEAHRSQREEGRTRSTSRNEQKRQKNSHKRPLKRRHQSGGSSSDRTEEKTATTPESTSTPTAEADEVAAVPSAVLPVSSETAAPAVIASA